MLQVLKALTHNCSFFDFDTEVQVHLQNLRSNS